MSPWARALLGAVVIFLAVLEACCSPSDAQRHPAAAAAPQLLPSSALAFPLPCGLAPCPGVHLTNARSLVTQSEGSRPRQLTK